MYYRHLDTKNKKQHMVLIKNPKVDTINALFKLLNRLPRKILLGFYNKVDKNRTLQSCYLFIDPLPPTASLFIISCTFDLWLTDIIVTV